MEFDRTACAALARAVSVLVRWLMARNASKAALLIERSPPDPPSEKGDREKPSFYFLVLYS